MKYWSDCFLKLIKELEMLEIENRSTSFSVWAQCEVGFHDKFSDFENIDYSNKIRLLIEKFELALITSSFSIVENELVIYLIRVLKEKMNKGVNAHIILETMYMSLFRISFGEDIFKVKKAMINLESLFDLLLKYHSLERSDIRILDSVISFLNRTQFSYRILNKLCRYRSGVFSVENTKKSRPEFKNIAINSIRTNLIIVYLI